MRGFLEITASLNSVTEVKSLILSIIVECLLCHMLGIKPFLLENLSETTGKNELPPKEEEWEELRFSDRLGNEKAA